uniref:Coiled-coil domain-containing protein 167 n=1 Tax=Pogona vitticeps TaxID=103695 RepID=A0ABM5FQP5_9SAUR
MSEKRQDSLSVAQQVDHLEDKLLHCREALEDIDFKLRREDLTLKRRESLEKQKSLLAMQAEAYGFCEGMGGEAISQESIKDLPEKLQRGLASTTDTAGYAATLDAQQN